ncbi:MAG: hypothetical protein ACRERV_15740 [Methylococcales bacterium]
MKKILIGLALLVVLAVGYKQFQGGGLNLPFMRVQMINPLPQSSPLYQEHQAFVDRFNSNEKIISKFGGTISSKGLFALQNEMHRRGAQALPRKQIIAENKAMVAMMARLPQRSCAKLARPRDDYDKELTLDVLSALERLPVRHHKSMTDFMYDAMVADVEGTPAIPVNQEAYDAALRDLARTYHGESAEKLMRIMSDVQGASDADACWAINSMMTAAEAMPSNYTEALMRRSWSN